MTVENVMDAQVKPGPSGTLAVEVLKLVQPSAISVIAQLVRNWAFIVWDSWSQGSNLI